LMAARVPSMDAPTDRPWRKRLPIRRKKASQGNDVLMTRVSKRKVDHGEREDRERRS
jgi:hypothetical protein